MSLDAATGELAWTPLEYQGPATHQVRARVTDNGVPILGVTNVFDVTVLESNLPPVLAAVPDQELEIGATLALQLAATDPDLPVNLLAFELVAGPAGAFVDGSTGWLSWTPAVADGGRSHAVVIRVNDNGSPGLASEVQFSVFVPLRAPPEISSVSSTQGAVVLVWTTLPGTAYTVQYTEDLAVGPWHDLAVGVVATSSTLRHVDAPPPDSQARFYRIAIRP
jgi:hypothetical protein